MKKAIIMRPYFDVNIHHREESEDDKAVIREMFMDNVYRIEGYHLRDGAVILDIGANIGVFTLLVLKIAQENNMKVKIYAVEPEENNLEILKQNLEDNPMLFVDGSTVEILPCAVSDFMGTTHITDESGSSRLSDDSELQEVDVITFDHLLEEIDEEKIDFAKIDIEGSEAPLIAGAKKKNLLKTHHYAIECDQFNDDGDFISILQPFLSDFSFETWGVPKQGCNLFLENHHWS